MDEGKVKERFEKLYKTYDVLRRKVNHNANNIGKIEKKNVQFGVTMAVMLILLFVIPLLFSLYLLYIYRKSKLAFLVISEIPKNLDEFNSEKFMHSGYKWWFRFRFDGSNHEERRKLRMYLCSAEEEKVFVGYGKFVLQESYFDSTPTGMFFAPRSLDFIFSTNTCKEVQYEGKFDDFRQRKLKIMFYFNSK